MQRRHSPPDNEIPGLVPFTASLLRTDDVVVAVIGVHAYSTGLSFEMFVSLRADDRLDPGWLGDELHGGRRPGSAATAFLLGVAYPDGRRASNIGSGRLPGFTADAGQPTLSPNGGGGGPTRQTIRYWLNPLPGPGDLTIVAAWPGRGLAETQTVIPADLIAAGVAGITEVWPWQPPEDQGPPPPPPPPDLPPGSWFAG